MQTIALCVLALAMGASGIAPGDPMVSPWMDTSMCSLSDSLLGCQVKKGQCAPVASVFSPPGGPVKAFTKCANATGVVLGPEFYLNIGLAFVSGSPESLADKTSADPKVVTAIRRCSLHATGLLNADMMTLNRTAVSASITSSFSSSPLGASVASAVASCPEPVDYNITDFITCLKAACMNNAVASPFINAAVTSAKNIMTQAAPAA